MLSVSGAFTTAATATVRKPKAKIEITWTDPYIDTSMLVTSNEANRGALLPQTADLITVTPYKWAYLGGTNDPDKLVLDGTFHPFPSTSAEQAKNQVGWYGQTACASNGSFSATYPKLTQVFAARSMVYLSVTGSTIHNEYPVDFTIKLYNVSNTLLHTTTVTGNTLLNWTKDILSAGVNTATKLELEITKWSVGYTVVKIAECYTSLTETYYTDDIVSMSILEERETNDGTLPIGNISANEMDLELQNISITKTTAIADPFSPSNTNSYLSNYIKPNRRIKAYLGFTLANSTIEYVPMGTFWTGDWKCEEKSAVVSVSARDRMELLRKAIFSACPVYENTTLYALAVAVLEDAILSIPMTDLVYSVDTALQSYPVPYAWFDKKSYMAVIREIVEACRGYAYMSRNDVLTIKGADVTT
jgi:hypothetical protein